MMKFWGLSPQDYPEFKREADIWPENWKAVLAFEALGFGNWNMGPGGPTGLRYEAFKEIRLALGVDDSEWPQMFEAIRIMESAALDEMYKDKDEE